MIETLYIIFSVLLGAIVGSFLNVVIIRLPQEGASIVFPSSKSMGLQKVEMTLIFNSEVALTPGKPGRGGRINVED